MSLSQRPAVVDRYKKEEEELERLEREQLEADKERKEDLEEDTLAPEEKSYKKRYGDLRRYMQEKEKELFSQINELKQSLEKQGKNVEEVPKTEQELLEFANAYPDFKRVMDVAIDKQVKEALASMEGRLKKVDDIEAKSKLNTALGKLKKAHPDWDELNNSHQFHDWLDDMARDPDTRHYWSALKDNPKLLVGPAVDAINAYKREMGIETNGSVSKANPKDDPSEVAASVKARGSAKATEGGKRDYDFKESEIARMSPKEYELKEEAILVAEQSGRILYDMTA